MALRTIALLLLCVFQIQLYSQIGISVGIINDKYIFPGENQIVYPGACRGNSYGLTYRKALDNYFSIEGGIYLKDQVRGFGVHLPDGYSFESDNSSFRTVPLVIRLTHQIPLIKNKLFILPSYGFNLRGNLERGQGLESSPRPLNPNQNHSGTSSSTYTFSYERSEVRTSKIFSPLIQVGLSFEIKLAKERSLNLHYNYFFGLAKYSELYVYTNLNNTGWNTSKGYSQGSYSNVGITYYFSRHKNEKKEVNTIDQITYSMY